MMFELAQSASRIGIGFAVVAFIIVSIVMMLVVLIQRPQGGGLSGAFGGGSEGSGQTAFGAKTGDVLTTLTVGIFVVFLGMAILLNFIVHNRPAPAAVTPTPASLDSDMPEAVGEPETLLAALAFGRSGPVEPEMQPGG